MTNSPETSKTRQCPECGQSFDPKRGRRFCTRPCQVRFNNRMAAEGKILAPLVRAMMDGRGGGHTATLPIAGLARSEVTRICRILREADRAAGRPPIRHYAEQLMTSGTLYMDRRRLPLVGVFGKLAIDPRACPLTSAKRYSARRGVPRAASARPPRLGTYWPAWR